MENYKLFAIFFSALILNNFVLMRFLALCSFFGVSDKMEASAGMSFAVTFVTVMATTVTWFIYKFVLNPLNLEFLRTLSFILIIASLVQLVEIFMKRFSRPLYKALGIFLPLITTNCAILAATFINIDNTHTLLESFIFSLGVAGGYALAIIIFTGLRTRLDVAPIPNFVKGYPIVFFTAALMSLAFMGFSGLFGIH